MALLQSIKKSKVSLFTIAAYLLTLVISQEKFGQALKGTTHYLREMLVVMPVIFMLTVLIEVWVSKDVILKNLGEKSGLKGFGFSVLLGSLSAGPIYAAFPIVKMLLSKGAGVANIVVILSTWAVIKVPMLANEAKFLGPRFMAIRWVLTVLATYLMGYFMAMFVKKEEIVGTSNPETEGLTIIDDYCVGCGVCVRMLPEVYELNNRKAQIKVSDLTTVDMSKVMQTIEKCPTKAITLRGTTVSSS